VFGVEVKLIATHSVAVSGLEMFAGLCLVHGHWFATLGRRVRFLGCTVWEYQSYNWILENIGLHHWCDEYAS
jgi:hypothetical protein